MPVIIRLVTEGDIIECGRIYSDAFSRPPYKDKWTVDAAADMLSGLFDRDPDSCWCVEIDSKIVGFAFCTTFGDFRATVQEFAVSPKFQKHGIGTVLMEYILGQFKNNGLLAVDLVVNRNAPALNLYKKFGFMQPENYTLMIRKL